MPKEAQSGRCIERQVAQLPTESGAIESECECIFEANVFACSEVDYVFKFSWRAGARMFDINKFFELTKNCIHGSRVEIEARSNLRWICSVIRRQGMYFVGGCCLLDAQ